MKSGSTVAIQRQATEQDDARYRIGGLCKAGSREIMMHETLGRKSAKETLDDALFQMQMDHIVADHSGIFKYNWPNGRLSSPVPKLLVPLTRNSQRVHRLSPGWVGT